MKRLVLFVLSILFAFSLVACDGKDTVKFDKGSVKVIAHRGLSGLETENTEAAFIAAGERSYYGIEGDVRKTADGKFVMSHDESLERLFGMNINVESSTLDSIKSIASKDKRKNASICELDGYIAVCKTYNKQAFLELKSEFTEQEIAEIISIINSHGYIESVVFISFSCENLFLVRKRLPEHRVQLLCSELDGIDIEKLISERIDISVSYKKITKELVERFHSVGLSVGVWTVNSKSTAENLVSLGVDYITTNILE